MTINVPEPRNITQEWIDENTEEFLLQRGQSIYLFFNLVEQRKSRAMRFRQAFAAAWSRLPLPIQLALWNYWDTQMPDGIFVELTDDFWSMHRKWLVDVEEGAASR